MTLDQDNPLLAQRASLNTYRLGAGFIWRRLKWDLNPESWRSRAVLRGWRDRHVGGKAVILCNGPSLLKVDFDLLQRSGAFCFGLNKINLLFDKTSFRPGCVVSVNPLVLGQNAGFYNQTHLPLFLDRYAVPRVKPWLNVAFLHSNVNPTFALGCGLGVFHSYTFAHMELRLALVLGFRHVARVGAAHNFAPKGLANKTVMSGANDESPFEPNHVAGDKRRQLHEPIQSEAAYTTTHDMYVPYGGAAFNTTKDCHWGLFERRPLSDFSVA